MLAIRSIGDVVVGVRPHAAMPERERNAGRSLVASVDGHQAYSPRVNVVPSSLTVDVEMLALSASLRSVCVVAVCVILLRASANSQLILS